MSMYYVNVDSLILLQTFPNTLYFLQENYFAESRLSLNFSSLEQLQHLYVPRRHRDSFF